MPLKRPLYFQNGEATMVDDDLMHKLNYGDPTLGWEGDMAMQLWYDNVDHRIYLTSLDDEGNEYTIMRSKPDVTLDSMQIIKMLVEHDRNKGFDLAKDMDTHDAKVLAEKEANEHEAHVAVAEKLAWGLEKDMH